MGYGECDYDMNMKTAVEKREWVDGAVKTIMAQLADFVARCGG